MESTKNISVKNILDADDESWSFETHSSGPSGKIPFTEEILIEESSGFHFGMSQSAGMGWKSLTGASGALSGTQDVFLCLIGQ